MLKGQDFSSLSKIFFVGIGGISMSAIAKYCILSGKTVEGSDISFNSNTSELTKLGAKVYLGHDGERIKGFDAVIYTSAVSENNEEVISALKQGIPVYRRSRFLSFIMDGYSNGIAVSGSHGKTTTTAMIANVFIKAFKDPTVFLGGETEEFSNLKVGKSQYFIMEACEYKRNFLDFHPNAVVVLNIDDDHLDVYKNIENEIKAFKEFCAKTLTFYNRDDENSKDISGILGISFGIKNPATYSAKSIREKEDGVSFTAYRYGKKLGRIDLTVRGIHNVYNALATIAVADYFGISFCDIRLGLESFSGVKRRAELIGNFNGEKVYADYAHHPTEIASTLKSFNVEKEKTLVIFQPHTYSRTKILMEKFIKTLSLCNNLIIYKTYPAREEYDEDGSAFSLYTKLKTGFNGKIAYAEKKEELFGKIAEINGEYKDIIFLGAGDIYDIGKLLTTLSLK